MKYAQKIKVVMDYMHKVAIEEKRVWITPTEIGGLFGGHSAIGSPLCKRMVESGFLVRNEKGHYKIKEN